MLIIFVGYLVLLGIPRPWRQSQKIKNWKVFLSYSPSFYHSISFSFISSQVIFLLIILWVVYVHMVIYVYILFPSINCMILLSGLWNTNGYFINIFLGDIGCMNSFQSLYRYQTWFLLHAKAWIIVNLNFWIIEMRRGVIFHIYCIVNAVGIVISYL